MRIAMLGTRGVPATYGGFETCVEEVGSRLAEHGHEVTVYCRGGGETGSSPTAYKGMRLVHLPALRSRSLETLSHTALSIVDVIVRRRVDVILLFNAANAPLIPLIRLRRRPVATHVDGLEWQRAKWGGMGRRYYRVAESLAVRWSSALIADAEGIRDYYLAEFDAPTELIRYGAPLIAQLDAAPLEQFGLESRRYHLVVARLEPENHVDLIVEGYVASGAADPLVVIGAAPYAQAYTEKVKALADERVRFLGSVWDQDLLNTLYSNALTYFHGHSVGGTNPSLLRAIGAGAATAAFDVSFNREVLGDLGRYWRSAIDVSRLVEEAEDDRAETEQRGAASRTRARAFTWQEVADGYEALCHRLTGTGRTRSPLRLSGRRRQPGWQPDER